jgi:hypothetical protein
VERVTVFGLQLVAVEDVRAGDILQRASGPRHVVLRVEGPFEDGRRVIVYASYEEAAYENRAQDKGRFALTQRRGRRGEPLAFEKGWRPLPAGALVPIARRDDPDALAEAQGALEAAERLRERS